MVASLAFATSAPLGKIAATVPAIAIAAARTAIAGIVLALVAPRLFAGSLVRLTARQRLGVLLAGALLGAHFALFLGGLATTSLASAVALISLEPLAVVLAAFLAFGLRPTRPEVYGLIVATVGAALVSSGAGEGEHRMSGDLLVLGAVVFYGAYVAAARGLRAAMPATQYSAAVYLTASLVLLPFALPLPVPSPRAAFAIVGLALVPTLIGHTLIQRAARTAPPALVALVSPGETIGAFLLGSVVFGAIPTGREGLGALVVIAGATLAIRGRRS